MHTGNMYPNQSRQRTLWIVYRGCQGKHTQIPDAYTTHFSEQDPSIQFQGTQRWATSYKNQWQNLSRVTYFTLVSFMLSLGHWKTQLSQLGWVSACLISAAWNLSACSRGYCQRRETLAGSNLSHGSQTPTLGSDSSLSGGVSFC